MITLKTIRSTGYRICAWRRRHLDRFNRGPIIGGGRHPSEIKKPDPEWIALVGRDWDARRDFDDPEYQGMMQKIMRRFPSNRTPRENELADAYEIIEEEKERAEREAELVEEASNTTVEEVYTRYNEGLEESADKLEKQKKFVAEILFKRALELIQRVREDLLARRDKALELNDHEGTLQLLRSLDTDTPDLLELSDLLEIVNLEVLKAREFEKKYLDKHLRELVETEMGRGGHAVARETVAQALNLGTKRGLTVEETLKALGQAVRELRSNKSALTSIQLNDLDREITTRKSRA